LVGSGVLVLRSGEELKTDLLRAISDEYARLDLSNSGGCCLRRDSFPERLQLRCGQHRRHLWQRRDWPELIGASHSGITEEWNGFWGTGPGDIALLRWADRNALLIPESLGCGQDMPHGSYTTYRICTTGARSRLPLLLILRWRSLMVPPSSPRGPNNFGGRACPQGQGRIAFPSHNHL
jgi:hypothetical protein